MGEIRNARACIREAWRDFRWLEYRPFAWIMVFQLLFLFLALNLEKPWGMAGAGWILRTSGEGAVHYPSSFLFLISSYARVETFLVAIAGSLLIPLSLARIRAPMIGEAPTGAKTVERARRAYRVTLVGYLLNVVLLIGWELLVDIGPRRWFSGLLGGIKGELVSWCLGVLVAFAIAAVFLYVPIRAVEETSTFRDSLWGGILEGLRSFTPTLFLVLAIAWPTVLLLAPLQIFSNVIVTKFRPELTVALLAALAILSSFVNYLIYSAASRLHWIGTRKEPA